MIDSYPVLSKKIQTLVQLWWSSVATHWVKQCLLQSILTHGSNYYPSKRPQIFIHRVGLRKIATHKPYGVTFWERTCRNFQITWRVYTRSTLTVALSYIGFLDLFDVDNLTCWHVVTLLVRKATWHVRGSSCQWFRSHWHSFKLLTEMHRFIFRPCWYPVALLEHLPEYIRRHSWS